MVESKEPSDGSTVAYEEMGLLIGEFHDVESFGDLWVKHEMKSNSAWEFDIEDGKTMTEIVVVSVLLVVGDGDYHAKKHKINDQLNTQGRIKHLTSLLGNDIPLIYILFEVSKDS